MKTQNVQLPNPAPKKYWEDSRWAHEHSVEISERYPNQWIAILNKKVIAAGKDGSKVEKNGAEKAGDQEFVIFFAEKGIHIYGN
ncbi:hypothetical protein ISS37_07830 [candidate division KSB1 bacterium]|nr:hypothetical protein [candidate division KSB1 bacterium]